MRKKEVDEEVDDGSIDCWVDGHSRSAASVAVAETEGG